MNKFAQADRPPTWLELESVRPLGEVEMITSLDRDTIIRIYPHLVVRVAPKRLGLKLKNALAIAEGTAPRS